MTEQSDPMSQLLDEQADRLARSWEIPAADIWKTCRLVIRPEAAERIEVLGYEGRKLSMWSDPVWLPVRGLIERVDDRSFFELTGVFGSLNHFGTSEPVNLIRNPNWVSWLLCRGGGLEDKQTEAHVFSGGVRLLSVWLFYLKGIGSFNAQVDRLQQTWQSVFAEMEKATHLPDGGLTIDQARQLSAGYRVLGIDRDVDRRVTKLDIAFYRRLASEKAWGSFSMVPFTKSWMRGYSSSCFDDLTKGLQLFWQNLRSNTSTEVSLAESLGVLERLSLKADWLSQARTAGTPGIHLLTRGLSSFGKNFYDLFLCGGYCQTEEDRRLTAVGWPGHLDAWGSVHISPLFGKLTIYDHPELSERSKEIDISDVCGPDRQLLSSNLAITELGRKFGSFSEDGSIKEKLAELEGDLDQEDIRLAERFFLEIFDPEDQGRRVHQLEAADMKWFTGPWDASLAELPAFRLTFSFGPEEYELIVIIGEGGDLADRYARSTAIRMMYDGYDDVYGGCWLRYRGIIGEKQEVSGRGSVDELSPAMRQDYLDFCEEAVDSDGWASLFGTYDGTGNTEDLSDSTSEKTVGYIWYRRS